MRRLVNGVWRDRVPNHGKLWKSLMRAHLGDYERYEEALKTKAQRGGSSEGLG